VSINFVDQANVLTTTLRRHRHGGSILPAEVMPLSMKVQSRCLCHQAV